MSAVLLTGATGLLGRYLLRDLLLAGESVGVLVRSRSDGIAGRQRIDETLRHFERTIQHTLPRPLLFEGDLHSAGLGLAATDREWLARHRPAVLHCAASIKFHRIPPDNEPYESNVEGTRRLLEFCADSGLTEFHHVSTAYVCGDRSGTIIEDDFDCSQKFRNDYEQSKFASEQLVRRASFLGSATFYRPSIIVGDSETGYTSTYHGFYLPLQLAHVATTAGLLQDGAGYMAALGLQGDERKNLVTVNWVSAVLVHLFRNAQSHRRTYHLTNPRPVTTTEIERAIVEAIGRAMKAAPRPTSANSSPPRLEDFRAQMEVYAAYLSDDPDFDRHQTDTAARNIPCPRLDRATLLKLAEYAIAHQFGWPRARPQPFDLDVDLLWQGSKSTAETQNGYRLRLEVSGSGGGVWNIAVNGGVPTVLAGKPDEEFHVGAYMNVHTLSKILARHSTVQASLTSGGIVFEGPRDLLNQGPDLLEALCAQFRQAQWDRPGKCATASSLPS